MSQTEARQIPLSKMPIVWRTVQKFRRFSSPAAKRLATRYLL
jgi:hypothetical protein